MDIAAFPGNSMFSIDRNSDMEIAPYCVRNVLLYEKIRLVVEVKSNRNYRNRSNTIQARFVNVHTAYLKDLEIKKLKN